MRREADALLHHRRSASGALVARDCHQGRPWQQCGRQLIARHILVAVRQQEILVWQREDMIVEILCAFDRCRLAGMSGCGRWEQKVRCEQPATLLPIQTQRSHHAAAANMKRSPTSAYVENQPGCTFPASSGSAATSACFSCRRLLTGSGTDALTAGFTPVQVTVTQPAGGA